MLLCCSKWPSVLVAIVHAPGPTADGMVMGGVAQTQKSCFLEIDVLPTAVCPSVHLLRTLSRHLSCLRFLMKQSYVSCTGIGASAVVTGPDSAASGGD